LKPSRTSRPVSSNRPSTGRTAVKERRKTLPPKLKDISDDIENAIQEARKIKELTIQEEVLLELDKVNATLEEARKQITKIMHP